MSTTAEPRNTGFWRTMVLYGLVMAALVFVLKYAEYKFWMRDLRMEVYVGVVALLFTALGVWVGKKLLEGRQVVMPLAAQAPLRAPPPGPNKAVIADLGISARELEVLELMAKGCSNQEIADQLFISLPTVKSHSSNLFVKLDVGRRTQAVHKAKELGILP